MLNELQKAIACIEEWFEALSKVINLWGWAAKDDMAYTTDEKAIILLSIDELRRIYDHICNTFDQLRIKALTLIVGEVAIVSFIFGTKDKLSIPAAADRRIFFATAVSMLVAGFGVLLWIISSVNWRFPHDIVNVSQVLKKAHSDEDEYLEYLHDDLVKDNKHNMDIISPRLKKFNWSVYLLSFGAIILLVLKYGGMQK